MVPRGHPRSSALSLQVALPVLILSLIPAVPAAAAPISIRSIGNIRIVAPPAHRPVYSSDQIIEILLPMMGREWVPGEVRERLEARYRFLGYRPLIEVDFHEGILDVTIRESRFLITVITRNPADLSPLGITRREEGGQPAGPDPGVPEWILRQELLSVEGDHDNLERYRQERFRLALRGFHIAIIPGETDPDTGFEKAGYLLIPRGQGRAARNQGEERLPPDKNFIGGNLEFAPRRGLSGKVVYRRWRWLTPFDTLEVSPVFNSEVGGEISYRTDYLLPGSIARRNVSLSMRAFSDLTRNRIINGIESDERRVGGNLFLGVALLPEKRSHDLQLGIEFERDRVTLESGSILSDSIDFSFLKLTVPYTYRHLYRSPKFQVRVKPTVIFSLAELGGEFSFETYAFDSDFHGFSLRRFEFDFHLLGGNQSGEIPPTEELSLGGSKTVRGFEADDFKGKRLVALQSELWFPLFSRRFDSHRLLSRLKGAVFLDAGAIDGGKSGSSGEAIGTGVGIRLRLPRNPLFLKFDYGTGIHGGGDGHFYVSTAFRY